MAEAEYLDGYTYEHDAYRLRSSGSLPIGVGRFLLQSFGVDVTTTITYEATTTLPITEDFMGANVDGQYLQASFQRLPYLVDINGTMKQIFGGTMVKKPEFINEEDML